jgi:hypothetical protein
VYEGKNIASDDSCGGPTQITITDPKLAALADNGGPGMTQALLIGSPAINAGTDCSVQVDQRYYPRNTQCDLGAYEFTNFTTVTLTMSSGATMNQSTGGAVVTGSVSCTRNETFAVAVSLKQTQKGKTPGVVEATESAPVQCDTGTRLWSVALTPSAGQFQIGDAEAKAQTSNAPAWITPASSAKTIKMFPGRK